VPRARPRRAWRGEWFGACAVRGAPVRLCASRRQAGLALVGRQHSAAAAGQRRMRTHGRRTPTRRSPTRHSPAASRLPSTGTQASGRAPGSGHHRGVVHRAREYGTSPLGLGLGNWGGLAGWGLGGWLLGLAGCFACGPYWAAPPPLVRCWCAPVLGCGLGSRAGSRARASWLGSARDFYELVKPARLGSLAAREPARACPSLNELEPARRARAFFPALGNTGHYAKDCPWNKSRQVRAAYQEKGKEQKVQVKQGRLNFTILEELPEGAPVMTGTFSVFNQPTSILFYSGASHNFISPKFSVKCQLPFYHTQGAFMIATSGGKITANQLNRSVSIQLGSKIFKTTLLVLGLENIYIILGTDWMTQH
jgi:hypothetical protein